MTKTQALESLMEMIEVGRALAMAESLFHWDATTTGVPEKSLDARGAAAGWLAGEGFRRFIEPGTLEAVETCEAYSGELSAFESAMVREVGREYRKLKAVPPEEFHAYMTLIARSEPVW